MKDLTLVIPAKDESESLPKVLETLQHLNVNIIISLKNNDLKTINSIKENEKVKIFYQSGTGYGNSLIEAINNCKTDFFCIFNADGSFEVDDINKMYLLIKNENDFVFTSRYEKDGGSEDDTIVTYIGNKFFSNLSKVLFSLKLNDILYTYLMGRTNSFKKLNIKSSDFRFCVELPIKMHLKHMRYLNIASKEKKRIAGFKKVNAIKDGFLILIEILRLFLFRKNFK